MSNQVDTCGALISVYDAGFEIFHFIEWFLFPNYKCEWWETLRLALLGFTKKLSRHTCVKGKREEKLCVNKSK